MKRIYFTILFLYINLALIYSQGSPGITIGSNNYEIGLSLCLTNNGGYAIAGSTRTTPSGSNDFYFVVIDSGGQIVVEKSYGRKHQDFFRKIIPLTNGYMFVGDSYGGGHGGSDIAVQKTDNWGTVESFNLYGTLKRDNGFDILQTKDNGFLLLGHSRLENPLGDIYLLKINNSGEEQWHKSYWEGKNDYAFSIITSSQNDGYVFVGSQNGFFDDVHADFRAHDADIILIKVDEDGNQIWRQKYGGTEHDFGYSVCNASDGGYYLFGSSQSYGNGSFDMLLIKTDKQGNEEWKKSFGGEKYEYGKSIVVNNEGDLYLVGSSKSFGTEGSVDIYIVKTDAEGNEIWSETFGNTTNDFGNDIAALPTNGCIILGSTIGSDTTGNDIYLLRLKSNGEPDLFADLPQTKTQDVKFYPNPMVNTENFELPESIPANYTIEIFDAMGKPVYRSEKNEQRFSIQKGNLSPGLYIYNITSKSNNKVLFQGKLIIQ